MVDKDDVWADKSVANFIWKHLCNADTDRFDFKPLLLDTHRNTPGSPQLTRAVSRMQEHGYVTVEKPNYDHYWVELNGSGKKICKKLIS